MAEPVAPSGADAAHAENAEQTDQSLATTSPQRDVVPKAPPSASPRKTLGVRKKNSTAVLISSTMERMSECIKVRPNLSRFPDLVQSVISTLPARCFPGYDPGTFGSLCLYATMYTIERYVEQTSVYFIAPSVNYAFPDTMLELPDILARAVEGFSSLRPNKSDPDHSPLIEVCQHRLSLDVQEILREYDLPVYEGPGRWDSPMLEKWRNITVASSGKTMLSLRPVDRSKMLRNTSFLGAGILIDGPTEADRDRAQEEDLTTVVGRRQSSASESLVGFLQPFFYYQVGAALYMPLLEEEDSGAVVALSGYFSGIPRSIREIKQALFSSVHQ